MRATASFGLRGRAHDAARAEVLVVLREHGPLSRTELARLVGLPKSTSALVVAELVASGSVVEQAGRPGGTGSGRGRPANLLSLAAVGGLVAGIDFGHRHVAVAVADDRRRVLAEESAAVDVDRRAADALDAAADLFAAVLARSGGTQAEVRIAAAGVPGPITAVSPAMPSPAILASWIGLDVRDELRARIGTEVIADNDANYGALGELEFGAGRGHRDFVYLKASHGIGAGLILDGRVYRGAGGSAGEIGHVQIQPDGAWCRCGNRGCLETVVSIDAVRQQLGSLGIDPSDSTHIEHPIARKVLAESGRTLGRVLVDVYNLLDPGMVILGGDLGGTCDAFAGGVRDSIERLVQPAAAKAVTVVPAALGRRSQLLGALAAAFVAAPVA
jgi:predicted NBD/HSP70 family sugar kinase